MQKGTQLRHARKGWAMSSVWGCENFITCPKCRGQIAKRGGEKKLKCYTCQIMLTPGGEYFGPIKFINNYARYEQTNEGKSIHEIRLNDIRNYTYRELVAEYENTYDRGTSRFLRMEAKKDAKYNANDFVRKRNKYELVDDEIDDGGDYTLPNFTPIHLKKDD